MNKWTLKSLAAAAVGLLTLAGQANAAVSYSYVTDQSTYDLTPNETRTVKLYLLETLTGGSPSLINADGGVLGAAERITRASGAATLGQFTYNVANFSGPASPAPPAGSNSITGTPTEIGFNETIGLNDVTGVPTGNGGANALTGAVFLGTLDVLAGTTPGQSVFNLRAFSGGPSGRSITFTNNYDLDTATSAAPPFSGTTAAANLGSFTVNVVPEPTFAGVALILGAAGSIIRRRRQA